MLPAIRKNEILQFINEHSSASVKTLAERFKVNTVTIRKDLSELHQQQLLVRTHGGAVSIAMTKSHDSPVSHRRDLNRKEKDVIGQTAASLVTDGDTIIVDDSSTVLAMVRYLKSRVQLTVVTNSVYVLKELSDSSSIEVIGVGGNFNGKTMSFLGGETEDGFKRYHVDRAFISPRGLTISKGMMDARLDVARIHRAAIACAEETIVLADVSKLGIECFAVVAPLSSARVLVMNEPPPDDFSQHLEAHGTRLLLPAPGAKAAS